MKKINHFILSLFTLFMISCNCYPEDYAPYVMSGEFVMEDGASDYSICGIDFYLLNKSDKEIKSFNLVFFLFDQDGEPAYECRSKISVDVEKTVASEASCSFCLSLDKYMNSIPEEKLLVDYLYLSEIEYADGSSWEDPYGLVAFK